MSTGYRINHQDIDELYESFPVEIAEQYNVTSSAFSDDMAHHYLTQGMTFKNGPRIIFPTSADGHLGGYNESNYRINNTPINVALKGCRPIGIPLVRLGPGTHYLNRRDGQTWLSSYPNQASGTRVEYDPKYLHVEVLGGGGGGGGSATMYASAGGGGGGYCYTTIEIPDFSYVKLCVGEKGDGGAERTNGTTGGDSYILDCFGYELCRACGGAGGGINAEDGGQGGVASGGIVNVNGGAGGKKEKNGTGVAQIIVNLDKPEYDYWERGSTSGGNSSGNNYGGGGGASAFSNGADANSNTTPSAAQYGAGGAGAGFKILNASNGGDGGEGFINLYY